MEKRLAYVLKNFFLIYESPIPQKALLIDYKMNDGARIFIPDLSNEYFDKKELLDVSLIRWRNYEGKAIPFLFASAGEHIISVENGRIILADDLISCIFYFLSGWQEHVSPEKDALGRFGFESSIQKKLNILQLPVVNYYFKILKAALEQAYQIVLINKLTKDNTFITCVTHDIDNWEKSWLREIKAAVLDFNGSAFINTLKGRLSGRYLYKEFDSISGLQQQFGFKSTFFLLPGQEVYEGNKSADYKISRYKYQRIIKALADQGNEIGLHGSFTASFNAQKLKVDAHKIPLAEGGLRYHYLMYDVSVTNQLIDKQGFVYDSTLGFSSHPGFRNSTSYPFYLYNFEKHLSTGVIEIPLIIMEVSLFFAHYLNFQTAEEAFNFIQQLLDEIVTSGGCLVLNWHNDAFANLKERQEWRKLFVMLLQFSKDNNGSFAKLEEVAKCLI